MKTNRRIAKRTLLILVSAFLLCLSINSISLAYDYQASEITPLAGYTSSRALGINNAGQVVGRFYNVDSGTGEAINRKGYIWDRTSGARLLSTLSGECSAWGINNNGYVSGYSYTSQGNQHAVIWNSTTNAITDIGTFRNTVTSAFGPTSTAYHLNDLNQVVGNADIPNDAGDFTPFHAFKYSVTTGIVDLGTFTTSSPEWQNGYSIAYDINGNGDAVGLAHDSSWAFLPFIHNNSTGMKQLPIDTTYASGEWYAVVINDNGLIGGHVIAATNQSLPYYWPNKSSAPVKITMPAGFPYGEIYGINASGQMVGIMWSSDQAGTTEHAFIFDTTKGVRDLNALIDTTSGWVLNFARDINDKGQVVGYGEKSGLKRGFVLDPGPFVSGEELAVDFGPGKGLWNHTGSSWVWLSDWLSDDMAAWSGGLAVNFGSGNGFWNYTGSSWVKLTDWLPVNMAAWSGGLAVNFGSGNGFWNYNGSSWVKLTDWLPVNMAAWSGGLAVNFGSGKGFWNYNGSSWDRISPDWLPVSMAAWSGGLAVNFGSGKGFWYCTGSSWVRLSPDWLPVEMVAWDGGFAVNFGSGKGFWNYNGSSWHRISPDWLPVNMAAWGGGLAVNFGSGKGCWNYNGSSWSQLSGDWIPLNMEGW
jgi:probable HAF family extracellular repeat protein